MTNKRIWTCVLLTVALTVSLATSGVVLGKGGKGKPKPPPPEPELPAVRYRIDFVDLPENSTGESLYINDTSNLGVIVGKYASPIGSTAFIYFPGSGQAIDLNTLVVDGIGIPDGAWLRSGVAINEWGVVVGSLEYLTGEVVGFALDLGTETPVVDLLPNLGSTDSHGSQINENGDLLGFYYDGDQGCYLFNPRLDGFPLYNGDPIVRALRNGLPQDFSEDATEPLPVEVVDGRGNIDVGGGYLNNPLGNRPAQIAGFTSDGIAYRYTTGASPDLELFPTLDLGNFPSSFGGLNDSGTFCGLMRGPKFRGSTPFHPFRYYQSVEPLPIEVDWEYVRDIDSSGDMITNTHVYRDDWGFVSIDDLVTGDLAEWFSGGSVRLREMNDRDGAVDASQIVATLSDVTNSFVVLTPEPAPE